MKQRFECYKMSQTKSIIQCGEKYYKHIECTVNIQHAPPESMRVKDEQ